MAKSVAVIAAATIHANRRGSVPNIVKAWSIRLSSHGKYALTECCQCNRLFSISPTKTENPQFSLPACIAAFEGWGLITWRKDAFTREVEGIDALATDVYLS